MPSYLDLYVISERRDSETIAEFLNEFLPLREESADNYAFPQYTDYPDVVFNNIDDALKKCIAVRDTVYSLYWRAVDNKKPEHAMLFFLKDGNVIYGLSTDENHPDYAAKLLQRMKALLNSDWGYIDYEAPPNASNLDEFKDEVGELFC